MDIERHDELIAYLRRNGHIGADERLLARTLTGGVSNRVVHLRRESGEARVLKQALAKLRVPVEWFSDPSRIEREALGMQWLARLAPAGAITPLIFVDPAEHLLAMRAVAEPHENWKTMLLAGRVEEEHAAQFGRLLAAIHTRSAGDADLARVFDDRSFFESLRIEPYYAYSAQQVPEADAFLSRLIDRCRSRRLALVHGDYSPKNILIHDGRLVLLDHEVVHYGDPAFDLGFALAHLLSKAHHLPAGRSQFAEAASIFWREYLTNRGSPGDVDLESVAVHHTLGCLLARVVGRSQVEYLTAEKKRVQQSAAVSLMSAPPARMPDLIAAFIALCR